MESMAERRRLADDLVGAPGWARWFAYAVFGVFMGATVALAVFLPYMAYRLTGGVWALVLVAAFELGCLLFMVAARRSARLRRWYGVRDDGTFDVDTTRWRHWDRFIP